MKTVEFAVLHWSVVAACVILILTGVSHVVDMSPHTDEYVRWAYIIRTTGATLLGFAHLMCIFSPEHVIADIVPMVLVLFGGIFCQVAEKHDTTNCNECLFGKKNGK